MMKMNEVVEWQARQKRRQAIAAWSDASINRVEQFVARHIDQIGRGLTNAQMSGLQNVVRSQQTIQEVLGYIEHQRNKAERQNRQGMEHFWRELAAEFKKLEQEAAILRGEMGSSEITAVQHTLISEFVQHLGAEVRHQGRGR